MRTPLYDRHAALGGKIVDFAGWELPVQYPAGILAEHRAVREAAGLFDVSHMGEILVSGEGAPPFLQRLLTNNLSRLTMGRAVYSPLCAHDGGVVDDLIVYPYGADYLVVVNASNTDKDFAWFRAEAEGQAGVTVQNVSADWAQLALQGPKAREILAAIGGGVAVDLPFFGCGTFDIRDTSVFVSATGYTGERGFEIYLPPDRAGEFWDALIEAGAEPCGLGARDTLRMEAALPLYGHELSADISPLEAGLSRFVKFDHDFIGRAALEAQRDAVPRRLAGLVMRGRAIPRAGYGVTCNGEPCGTVTSGGVSPARGQNIALALVRADAPGDGDFAVVIRGRAEAAGEVALPFYKAV